MTGEGNISSEMSTQNIKEDIVDTKLRLLGAKGTILREVLKAKKALGEEPKKKLNIYLLNGIDSKDIAKRISTLESSISPFAIFVLRRLFIIPGIEGSIKSGSNKKYLENSEILSQVYEKFPKDDFIERLSNMEYLIYFVRYQLGTPPYLLNQLASDLHVSREKISITEDGIFDRLKKSLEK